MLKRISDVTGATIQASDGAIGSIDDLYFEDDSWAVRWVVVDTGTWLPGRRVLLPPEHLSRVSPAASLASDFAVDLTRQKVKESPPAGSDKPVSRQMEASLYGYYGWMPFWGPGVPGTAYIPPLPGAGAAAVPPYAVSPVAAEARAEAGPGERRGDPTLRSAAEVTGYYIQASDGDIGHVEDFVLDLDSWHVRYMMVDTKNWWPGKKVLVSPRWIDRVSWDDRQVFVRLTREAVKQSPEYQPATAIDRDYERRLHAWYGFPHYWD